MISIFSYGIIGVMQIKKKVETSLVLPVTPEFIERRIHLVRGHRIMLSIDLAELYQVEPRSLIQTVKRNIKRFPNDFMFQLTVDETENLKSQFVISSWGGRRHSPYAFTELGIAMLSSVLNSEYAVQMNIFIMRAFVSLRRMIASNKDLANKFDNLELEQGKQRIALAEIFSVVKRFMDAPIPPKGKIGFNNN